MRVAGNAAKQFKLRVDAYARASRSKSSALGAQDRSAGAPSSAKSVRTTADAWMSIGVVASFVADCRDARAFIGRGGEDHDAQTETLLSASKGIAAGGYGAAL